MRVVSVNIGEPRTETWKGRELRTGIFKNPAPGRLRVKKLGLEGDRQADLEVHGGADKAVYSYAAEHYAFWEKELGRELPLGMFGENLTTEGLDDQSLKAGDRFRIGEVLLEATVPRQPCSKLGLRFGDAGMVKRFQKAGRFGFYFRVLAEGEIATGDTIKKG